MARSVSATNRLVNNDPAAWTAAGSVFCRFKPTSWSSGDSTAHAMWGYGTTSQRLCYIVRFSDNSIYAGWLMITPSLSDARVTASDAGHFTSGVWANWLMTWNSATPIVEVFRDNASIGTDTSAFTPTTTEDVFTIGCDADQAWPADGDIAEWARWDHVLDSTERAELQSTGNPECVPTGLLHHYKVLGDVSPEPDEVGSEDLVLVGTPAQATHPTVGSCGASPQDVILPLLAAAGQFFTPTVTPGVVTVTLPVLAATGQFFSPTIVSDQTITLPLMAAGGQFFTPTVSHVAPKGLTIAISDRLAPG